MSNDCGCPKYTKTSNPVVYTHIRPDGRQCRINLTQDAARAVHKHGGRIVTQKGLDSTDLIKKDWRADGTRRRR